MQALRAFLNKEHSLLNSLKEIADPQGRFADKSREATSLDDVFIESWDDSKEGGKWHNSLQVGLALSVMLSNASKHRMHIVARPESQKMARPHSGRDVSACQPTRKPSSHSPNCVCWLAIPLSCHLLRHFRCCNTSMILPSSTSCARTGCVCLSSSKPVMQPF